MPSARIIVSQQLGATNEIVVIEHTGCALHGADAAALRERIGHSVGLDLAAIEPSPDFGEFADLEANLRAQVERIRAHPLIKPVPVHGLIFDVRTGSPARGRVRLRYAAARLAAGDCDTVAGDGPPRLCR